MKNNILDLFSGAGGLSLGFEMAGFNTYLAIDFWKDAIDTFNYNRNKKVGKNIKIEDLSNDYLYSIKKEIIGVIGGPPCQGFSTVGTRDKDDPRNHLYKEYVRVVEIVEPEFFLIENVKGILTLSDGYFKQQIIDDFKKLGYDVKYKLLNASNYGIPQNRWRVFFVGFKNSSQFDFPEPFTTENKVSVSDAISDLPSLDNYDLFSSSYLFEPQNEYQTKMRNSEQIISNHEPTNHTEQTKKIISLIPDGGKIKDLPEQYWKIRKYNKAFQRMNSSKPSNTIDTGHRNYFHYKENRVPSVRESARIQSFPDGYVFTGSKTSQYKQVGNAVPPLLALEIAKQINSCL